MLWYVFMHAASQRADNLSHVHLGPNGERISQAIEGGRNPGVDSPITREHLERETVAAHDGVKQREIDSVESACPPSRTASSARERIEAFWDPVRHL